MLRRCEISGPIVAARWCRNWLRSWRQMRRGARCASRLSRSDSCSGSTSPNSTRRLRPFRMSDRSLRKRPPMSQSSATISRNQERCRPGARPKKRLTGSRTASNSSCCSAYWDRLARESGSRRSTRSPRNPARRSRKIVDRGSDGSGPKGTSGGGSPNWRQTYSSTAMSTMLRFSSTYTTGRPSGSRAATSSGRTAGRTHKATKRRTIGSSSRSSAV